MSGDVGNSKCAFVALVGPPNAGKSTLLNQQVGAKVSIVSHKVQTTRAQIRGIAVAGDTQFISVLCAVLGTSVKDHGDAAVRNAHKDRRRRTAAHRRA